MHIAIINIGKLWTGDNNNNNNNSNNDAIGIIDNKIAAISSTAEILKKCSNNNNTRIIDCKGKGMVLPGFNDCHVHFLDGGVRLNSVKLRDVTSKEEFRRKIKEFIHETQLPADEWITGGDWNHYAMSEEGVLPDVTWLDDITPANPVFLNRLDGHMAVCNSLALQKANISKDTKDIDGGVIERFADGTPAGVLKDNAQNLVTLILPKRKKEFLKKCVVDACKYVVAFGVTGVHTMVTVDCQCGLWPSDLGRRADEEDMSVAFEEVDIYSELAREGKLFNRISAQLPLGAAKQIVASKTREQKNNGLFKLGGLKVMLDGSLGSHTCRMLEDFDDAVGDKGCYIWDLPVLEKYIQSAADNGFQVIAHAIGDAANRTQLDMFERVSQSLSSSSSSSSSSSAPPAAKRSKVEKEGIRFRIEHAQHIHKDDIPRFGKNGVIASMQLSHLATDGVWAERAIGKRIETSWPMASLVKSGATVVLGSDWFVTLPNPMEGIHAAVTRQTDDGKHPNGLVPSECVTVEQALIAYTSAAAYATFEEDERGTLTVGKKADIVILNQNLLAIPSDAIKTTKVLTTIVDGKIVFHQE